MAPRKPRIAPPAETPPEVAPQIAPKIAPKIAGGETGAPRRRKAAAAPAAAPAEPEKPAEPAPAPTPPVVTARPVALVENLMAPETFASEAFSISLVQGMISIAFTSPRYDYAENPSVMKKVVVSRLVIPPAGALSMAVRLFALLDKHGLGAAPKDPQARQ